MMLRLFLFFLILSLSSMLNAQNSFEAQNKILQQFDHLIPKSASFASWTLFTGDINGDKKKDYIFSYILTNKYQRSRHAGSGVLVLTKDRAKKFKILGHIPAKNNNIYSFNSFSKSVLQVNEYDAASQYQRVKRILKFKQRGNKFVQL